jgi:hypothetical protein
MKRVSVVLGLAVVLVLAAASVVLAANSHRGQKKQAQGGRSKHAHRGRHKRTHHGHATEAKGAKLYRRTGAPTGQKKPPATPTAGGSSKSPPPAPGSSKSGGSAPPPTATPGQSLYGVTLDDVSGMSTVIADEAALPYKSTTRVVLDHAAADQFTSPIQQLHGTSNVMALILDSAGMSKISNAQVDSDTRAYTSAFGSNVDIWEIGNEVNGNWTGSYSSVSQKMQTMYNDVKVYNPNAMTALTLYYNNPSGGPADNCGDGTSELTPQQFTQQYVPSSMANGLNYVLLSYYPTQCGNYEPTSAQLASDVKALHALYPNAKIGFGELGTPNAASNSSASQASQIMQWGYSLNPGLPYYIGGYFWWYGAEDVFGQAGGCGCLRSALSTAYGAEHSALG